MERDGRESGSDTCKSVTYTALLWAHLQQQWWILSPALTAGSALCWRNEVGQEGGDVWWQKQRPRAFALHLFEKLIRKKHSPLSFVVRQMFSGISLTLSEGLTLPAQQDPVGSWFAHKPPALQHREILPSLAAAWGSQPAGEQVRCQALANGAGVAQPPLPRQSSQGSTVPGEQAPVWGTKSLPGRQLKWKSHLSEEPALDSCSGFPLWESVSTSALINWA